MGTPVDFLPLDIAPGLFTLDTPGDANRRWFDGENVRWDDGKPMKIGGYIEQALLDDDAVSATYMGKARSYHQWESLDGLSWMAFGTACKLYLIGGDVLFDITPLRRQIYLTNAITTINGSRIVTVVDVGHDAANGDHFSIEGGTAVGGITMLGEYSVLEVIDADSYTVDTGVAATSGATGGGSMTVRYDISCGLESDGFLYGYGVGDYGEEEYGTPRSTSTFRGYARIWSLDNWGEDLIASPNGETMYVWRRATGPQSRAEVITGAPANVERMIIGPDNLHILAIGTNLASSGVQDKMFIRWCAQNNYNDWVATSENDVGSKRLDLGSRLITAVKTNRLILVWSDKALYVTSFVGGQDVYDFTLVGSSPKVISPNAAIDVDGIVFVMTENDFYIYDGTYTPLQCDIRNYVFGDKVYPGINRNHMAKVTCRLRREFNEVHWHVAMGDSTENTETIIFNYKQKCWYKTSIAREAGGDVNPFYALPTGLQGGRLWLDETGVDAYNGGDTRPVALATYLESWEGKIAEGSYLTEVTELQPDFLWLYGSMILSVFGRNEPQELRFFGPDTEFTEAKGTMHPKFKRRQLGFRIDTVNIGDDWRMGTWHGKYLPHGR